MPKLPLGLKCIIGYHFLALLGGAVTLLYTPSNWIHLGLFLISISIVIGIIKKRSYTFVTLLVYHSFYVLQAIVNFLRSDIPLTLNNLSSINPLTLILLKLLIELSIVLYIIFNKSANSHLHLHQENKN